MSMGGGKGGGGGGGTVQSQQKNEPWAPQQPYLTDIFGLAQDLQRNYIPEYYAGPTTAPFTGAQNDALQRQIDAASSGSPVLPYAQNFENSLLGGGYFGGNNPAYSLLQGFAQNGLPGSSTLSDQAQNGISNPAASVLMGYSTPMSNPATPYLTGLASHNAGQNAGSSMLSQLGSSNPAVGAPGTGTMHAISEGLNPGLFNPGSEALRGLAGTNLGYDAPGNSLLYGLASHNQALGNTTGANTLSNLSSFNSGLVNPFNSPLAEYASGAHVGAEDPYTKSLVESIRASVLPGIQSQFIQGGALSSPEAARASAEGVTAALAPSLFQRQGQEEQNQLSAAQALSGQYMQGVGQQGSLAQALANLGLSGAALQGSQAQNISQNVLQGAGIQSGAAGTLGNLALGGTGLQGQLAQGLQSGYLTGNEQQIQASSMLMQGLLTGNQQMIQAATDLGSQALQGQSLAQQAAQGAGTQYLQGGALQQGAAHELGNQSLQTAAALGGQYGQGISQMLSGLGLAPTVQQMPYTDISQLYNAGATQQQLDQMNLNNQVQRYNYYQQLPYQKLNQYIGQVTGNYGGTSTLNQPNQSNPMANLMGLGMGANSLLGSNGMFGSSGMFGSGGALGGMLGGGSSFAPVADGLLGGFSGAGAAGPLSVAAVDGGLDFGPALAATAMAWIVCTELMKQGRLRKRWWVHGAKVFAKYPEIAKRGYYVWAIPSVRHLRKKPNSLYSRTLEKVFNWRAEDIAARAGVKGARKLWRGRMVTAALALPCVALGAVVKKQDWQAVYRDAESA